MDVPNILESLNNEIDRLTKVRDLLTTDTPQKRKISPEGRARMVAAQKKRWAKYHKAA